MTAPSRFIVRTVEEVNSAIANLPGRERDTFQQVVAELAANGCQAGGYRLLGANGDWSRFCCRHGYATQRIVLTFLEVADSQSSYSRFADRKRSVVIVGAVGRHDDERFYSGRAELGIGAVGRRRDWKPDCCGSDGWPSVGEPRAAERRTR